MSTGAARRPLRAVVVAGLLGALLCGCGESQQAKAEKDLCTAKSDISKQIHDLQSLNAQTVTVSKLKESFTAIQSDFAKISASASKLSGTSKQQAQAAAQTLSGDLDKLKASLTELTLPAARSQLSAAISQFATSVKQAFSPIQCSTG